ncbi:MAG: hypothetical protein SFU83_15000 [Meiothermus sp.]|nr:hypothetical protein [Meiothermus sp.]
MRRWLSVLLFGVLVLAQGAGYYPSKIGWSWTYSSGEVQTLVRDESGVLVLERRFPNRPVVADLLRYTPDKGVLLEGILINGREQRYSPALQLYPQPPLYIGQRWGGRSRFNNQSVALIGEVNRVEGVNVPAGRFNAYVLRTSTVTGGGGNVVLEVYFVPGVGVVRYATTDGAIDLVKLGRP